MSRDSLRLGLEAGGGVLPGPPDLIPVASSVSCGHGGGSNAGAPTLTTPTVTPTTLRNIEQMFADRDPHEPPPHHANAAGFAPPIISPTSGNSYVPLGQVTPLNCHRDRGAPTSSSTSANIVPFLFDPSKDRDCSSSASSQSSNSSDPPQHLLVPQSVPELNTPSDLTIVTNGHGRAYEKPPRPTNLSFSRGLPPPPLLEAPTRHRLTSEANHPDNQLQPSDLSISVRSQILTERTPSLQIDRPPSLQIGQFNLNGAGLLSKNMEMMDKLLKAVASSPAHLPSAIPVIPPPLNPVNTSFVMKVEQQNNQPFGQMTSPPYRQQISPGSISQQSSPPYRSDSPPRGGRKPGGRRPTMCEGTPEEANKRCMRRERNKQAAARCRKRRMDLTCTLQGEVEGWEDKVRALKEELLQLESQKKGLESVLRRHQGPCKKVHKSESNEN
eukprot:GFUD01067531.1.p1 GENE.GFUD01067531.1~~GFUD01067531.1.p1  ORF type:complete len:441 (-),score=74.38 GFUD01067531.1:272-1594(-)